MTNTKKITGKVAAIVNERELVINLGEKANIKIGMKFNVLDEPTVVKDPETKEELDVIRRVKIKVKIVEVRPKCAIARTYETYTVNEGGTFPSLTNLFKPRRITTRVRTLRYDDSGLDYAPIDETSSFVNVGDVVELLVEEETEILSEAIQEIKPTESTQPEEEERKDVIR
ncbi:hypothetical protein KA005_73785 [bacterium]|nr:hypothetical protein [bacterium]